VLAGVPGERRGENLCG